MFSWEREGKKSESGVDGMNEDLVTEENCDRRFLIEYASELALFAIDVLVFSSLARIKNTFELVEKDMMG